MKISKTVECSNISNKLSDIFLTVIDLFFNKYLFLTLLINIAIVTKPVVSAISVTTGMYMYYTSETSSVGNRPCRFFGLFSVFYPDKYLFMTVFKIMYFAALLLISLALYLLIRRLLDTGKRTFVIFGMTLLAAKLFQSSDREVLSLTLMYAFACSFFALYCLAFGKGFIKHSSLMFAAIAVLIDVRSVYLCVIIAVVMITRKYIKEKTVNMLAGLMIVLTLTVFAVSAIASNDNKNPDEVKKYFEVRYSENYDRPDNYTDEETGTYHMSNGNSVLLPDGFFKVTVVDLVTEWVPNLADTLLSFTFEDIFQGLCYVYMPVIVIYNHLINPKEEKHKSNT